VRLYFGGLLFVLIAFSTVSVGEPADSISAGAPTAADGRFTNSAGDIGHGSLAVRLPFMLRRWRIPKRKRRPRHPHCHLDRTR
jgi:hypothetical protein